MIRSVASAALLFALAAAAPPKDEGAPPADPRDKVVCKKFLETGSLVKGTRICKTKREWDAARLNLRNQLSPGGGGCVPGVQAQC